MKNKKPFIVLALLIALGFYGYLQQQHPDVLPPLTRVGTRQSRQSVAYAHQNRLSNIQVIGSGKVSHILRDDNKGSRHQKFIVSLPSGKSLLIVHNIDIAPKITALRRGNVVQFCGEYEWNAKGGIVHWTHHDPGGRHPGGWLEHDGKRYD